MRASLMRAYARWRHDARDIERGIAEAGQRLELDLDAVDVRAALTTTATCTLLLHGADDQYIPVAAAHALAGASPLVPHRELAAAHHIRDRTSGVSGQSGAGRVDLGDRRRIKEKKRYTHQGNEEGHGDN